MTMKMGIGIKSTHDIFHEIKNMIATESTSIIIDLNMDAKY